MLRAGGTVAVALLLLAGGLGAASFATAAAPPPVAPHPGATVSITPTNSGGALETSFSTGPNGQVYFTASDPSGDTSVVVTINDANASRDGLGTPVRTWTVPIVGGVNQSWQWGVHYSLPPSLIYGGSWNLTISGTLGGFASTSFSVHTYGVVARANASSYLPGHSGTIFYQVESTVNSGPYAYASSATAVATYTTTASALVPLPGSPFALAPAGGLHGFGFTVPVNAAANSVVNFVVYANVSTTGASETEMTVVAAWVGELQTPSVSLVTCNGCPPVTSVPAGTPVYVEVSESISSSVGLSPAADLSVKLAFSSGTTLLSNIPGNPPTSLTTDGSGLAEALFLADTPAFSVTAPDSVTATVTDPANAQAVAVAATVSFRVTNATLAPVTVSVNLDSLEYYGGDTATVSWALGSPNASALAGWTPNFWFALEIDANGSVLAVFANGTLPAGSSGTFTVAIPLRYSGSIAIEVDAYNATGSAAGVALATVSPPALFLTSSEVTYLPGDTVTVSVVTEGSVFDGSTLYASVIDPTTGYALFSGVLSGNSLQFTVPKAGTPPYVQVAVAAQSPSLGIVSSSTLDILEATGYVLWVGLATKSSYSDGSFQPGQSVTINYALRAVGTTVLPKSFVLVILPYSFSGSDAFETNTSQATGSVSYTIPSSSVDGAQVFVAEVVLAACVANCVVDTLFALPINTNPSFLAYEIGAGSGVTVGWLILLVLIVVVAIVLLLVIRRRTSPGPMAGPRPLVPLDAPLAAPGTAAVSSTPAPAEWQEGPADSDPPLPKPPASGGSDRL